MGPNGVVSLRTPRNEVLGFQGFNPSLDYFSWILFRDYRAKSCCYNGLYKEEVGDELKGGCGWSSVSTVLGQMTYHVASLTFDSPRSYVMQGASFTQGTVSSIPIGDSISPEGFLLPILLLVVIIVTVVIIAVILIVIVVAIVGVVIVVVIIRVVVVIDGVSSILKLSFVIIVTFPSMLLGLEIICLCLHGFDKELINLVLPDVRRYVVVLTCIYYHLKELCCCAQCLIEDEDFIKRSRSTHKTDHVLNKQELKIPLSSGIKASEEGNYMPPKRDLRLIDEYFKSVCVDVISNIAPGDVKTVESKHKTVDVNHKVVFSIVEPKPIRKNSFSPPIIEDWHSDDESEVEISTTVAVKIVKPSIEKIKFVKTARETVKNEEYPKQQKHHPRGNQRN
nr:hypothetical protein [Tanacetum cinerariifolium]